MPTDYTAIKEDLAHQSPEQISAMFGRVAARYDLMNFVMGGGLHLYWESRLVRAVAAQSPERVLDLATGSGDVLLALERRRAFTDATFDAITISWGLRNFADRAAGLREMRRVLRPGGRAYVLEFSHPAAWLAPLYFGYMRRIMPLYAQFITPERGAYEYLGDSIRAFPAQPQLAHMMRQAGFAKASWTNLTLGIAALHIAEVKT